MSDSRNIDETAKRETNRFQFGIRQLLLLTALSALAAATASSMSAPKIFQAIVAAYLILMAGYVVLRIPHLFRRYFRAADRFKRQRAELEAMAANKRRQIEDARRLGK